MDIYSSAHLFFLHGCYFSAKFVQIRVDICSEQQTACTALLVGGGSDGASCGLCLAHVAEHTHQSGVSFRIGEYSVDVAVFLYIDKFAGGEAAVAVDGLVRDVRRIDHRRISVDVYEADGQFVALRLIILSPKSLAESFKDFTSGASKSY